MFRVYPYLSVSIRIYPCLSLSIRVCPCLYYLRLSVSADCVETNGVGSSKSEHWPRPPASTRCREAHCPDVIASATSAATAHPTADRRTSRIHHQTAHTSAHVRRRPASGLITTYRGRDVYSGVERSRRRVTSFGVTSWPPPPSAATNITGWKMYMFVTFTASRHHRLRFF